MRIIGGKYKGKRFNPPRNNPARPTTDFAKESLFNILANYFNFDAVSYLDLFGGTGSLSFEMASRGCRDITLVEWFQPNVRFIRDTAQQMDMPIQVIRGDVYRFLETCPRQFDLIFAGPPYADKKLDQLPNIVLENKLLTDIGWFILEHSPRHDFRQHPNCRMHRHYGQTNFSIFTYETH